MPNPKKSFCVLYKLKNRRYIINLSSLVIIFVFFWEVIQAPDTQPTLGIITPNSLQTSLLLRHAGFLWFALELSSTSPGLRVRRNTHAFSSKNYQVTE